MHYGIWLIGTHNKVKTDLFVPFVLVQVQVDCAGDGVTLHATGSDVTFPGHLAAYAAPLFKRRAGDRDEEGDEEGDEEKEEAGGTANAVLSRLKARYVTGPCGAELFIL